MEKACQIVTGEVWLILGRFLGPPGGSGERTLGPFSGDLDGKDSLFRSFLVQMVNKLLGWHKLGIADGTSQNRGAHVDERGNRDATPVPVDSFVASVRAERRGVRVSVVVNGGARESRDWTWRGGNRISCATHLVQISFFCLASSITVFIHSWAFARSEELRTRWKTLSTRSLNAGGHSFAGAIPFGAIACFTLVAPLEPMNANRSG